MLSGQIHLLIDKIRLYMLPGQIHLLIDKVRVCILSC
jgi:hypothetical protein